MSQSSTSSRAAPSRAPTFAWSYLAPRHWPVWFGLGVLWLLTWLPWPVRSAISSVFGTLAWALSGKRRRIADINLQWCLPELDARQRAVMIRRHFRYKLRVLLDYPILWWGSRRRVRRLIRLQGEEHYRIHHEQGRPVILLTPHTVALDAGGAAMSLRYPGLGMFKPAGHPLANWLMAWGRTRFGAQVVARNEGLMRAVRLTRGGKFLYYLADEDLGERHSVFAPFFGVPAATLHTLGRLAKACNAVVVPIATYYEPRRGRYVTHLLPAMEHFPTGSVEEDAARMNQELEKLIRLCPEQYLWTMKLFKTRPAGESPPY